MIFWVREIAGWALLLLGLAAFAKVYELASEAEYRIFEIIIMTVVGVFVFRGGIHLLKVAVAAGLPRRPEEAVPRSANRLGAAADGPAAGASRLALVTAFPSPSARCSGEREGKLGRRRPCRASLFRRHRPDHLARPLVRPTVERQ